MRLRSGARRHGKSAADLDALHGVDAHHRLRQLPVQLAIPHHVRTKPDRHSRRHHLEDASQRIPGFPSGIDRPHHSLAGFRVGAADRRFFHRHPIVTRVRLRTDISYRHSMRVDFDAELLEEAAADRPHRHARRRLPRRRPLQHVARIIEAILHTPRQVRVPGPQPRHLLGFAGVGPYLHYFLPILPYPVLD